MDWETVTRKVRKNIGYTLTDFTVDPVVNMSGSTTVRFTFVSPDKTITRKVSISGVVSTDVDSVVEGE